jgi:hypothetical protein
MTLHPLHCLGFEPISASVPVSQQTKTFPSRNGGPKKLEKGTRVRLEDGTLGRVVYADPDLRIARVRTVDGRKMTVRCKTLTQVRP